MISQTVRCFPSRTKCTSAGTLGSILFDLNTDAYAVLSKQHCGVSPLSVHAELMILLYIAITPQLIRYGEQKRATDHEI